MSIPATIIERMKIPDLPGLFHIGCNAIRVTVYSQQVRSLNLAWALKEEDLIHDGSRVAIIGSGAAGLTAALALGRLGCAVTIFEREERILSRFRGNTHRFLHPHVFDWPASASTKMQAELPLMNWEASTAHGVTLQLERAFTIEKLSSGKIDLKLGVNVSVEGENRYVSWSGNDKGESEFDLIIFAVGVGTEKKNFGTPKYWENDSLSQIVHGGPRTILISGTGDGGLIDLTRALVHDFDHARIISQFLSSPRAYALTERLQSTEATAGEIDRMYSLLDLSGVSELIVGNLRSDRQVTLYFKGDNVFNFNTMILNRVLTECLRRNGLNLWNGDVDIAVEQNKVGGFTVTSDDEVRNFDLVIQRHGVVSDLGKDFQDVYSSLPSRRTEPDPSRQPAWPRTYFDSKKASPKSGMLPKTFSVVEIDAGYGLESRAWSMNENGTVVGWSYLPTYPNHSFFIWHGTGLPPELGHIPYSGKMSAQDINSHGDFVVVSEGGSGQGWLVTKGGITILAGPYSNGMPYSINDEKTVVGYCNSENGINSPCMWKNDKVRFLCDLGHGGVALQLNNSEVVVGELRESPSGKTAAARWTNGSLETFSPPAAYYAARAFRVNSKGDAAGYLMGGGRSSDFFVWPADGEPEIVGQGEAYGINDFGWVVGRAGENGAFLYSEGRMHWLNDLVNPSWAIVWPFALLNDLRVAGVARKDGIDRAVILVPEY